MQDNIYQLYHVARCGSTLLSSILSTVVETYTEPHWAREMLLEHNVGYRNLYSGKLIKFPSMILMNQLPRGLGKKVFLYRPLIQHLYKIIRVEDAWKKYRYALLREHVLHSGYSDEILNSNWKPDTDMELIAYQWLCSMHQMLKHGDVLWIKTNDFLKDKEKIVHAVTDYLNLPEVSDFSFKNINVKRINVNGNSVHCNMQDCINNSPTRIEYVDQTHGVIETSEAITDTPNLNIVKQVEAEFPELARYCY
jgi:hypothetical protein